MARLGSQALAGYYPTPEALIPDIADLVTWSAERARFNLCDPCAGEGQAINALREAWFGSNAKDKATINAIEMEAERFQALERGLAFADQAVHADAFKVQWGSGQCVNALYLNPPYDTDPDFGRLEHRFLARFTELIANGGALLFVVPFHALSASAEHLARHYRNLRCYRFPDPEFRAYKQVVVVGQRQRSPLHDPGVVERIRGWAEAPVEAVLGSERAVFRVEQFSSRPSFEALEFDLPTFLASNQPAKSLPLGLDLDVHDLLGRRYPVALPPKPAHVAMALMAGIFNGHPISPDSEFQHLPDILIKGTTRRDRVEVQKKHDKHGEQVASVQVEQPSLKVTALVLGPRARYVEISNDLDVKETDDIGDMGIGDILHRYQGGLAELMDRQFPALHDPRIQSQQFQMPAVSRPPFAAQANAIRAALKLISLGRHPLIQQETGTGKSQVALTIRAALSPEHHAETSEHLRSQGLVSNLPLVRRTLIACPPHLLDGWRDEVQAVTPEARVVVVDSISDLWQEGEVYLVTRERLKLGHAYHGVANRCPKCAASLPEDADTNARRRLRCDAVQHLPANIWAEWTRQLAQALLPAAPADGIVTLASFQTPRLDMPHPAPPPLAQPSAAAHRLAHPSQPPALTDAA